MTGFFSIVQSAFTTSGLEMAPYKVLRIAQVEYSQFIHNPNNAYYLFNYS